MSHSLRNAYSLIGKYRRGGIKPGTRITKTQQQLLVILAMDLAVVTKGELIQNVVPLLAEADSRWNRRTQSVVNELYVLRGNGRTTDARALRKSFISECPSHWYRGIVASV
jgi:hypothetical protein